jgi:hypothetical protein
MTKRQSEPGAASREGMRKRLLRSKADGMKPGNKRDMCVYVCVCVCMCMCVCMYVCVCVCVCCVFMFVFPTPSSVNFSPGHKLWFVAT